MDIALVLFFRVYGPLLHLGPHTPVCTCIYLCSQSHVLFFFLFHQKHQYILEPTSAQAKMKRNASALPLRSRQMPRFVVDVHVEKIPLSLEETQYKMLIALMDGFERHFRQRRYLKWRPKSPIKKK